MSLDVHLTRVQPTEVYWANHTHNCGDMAEAAGVYGVVWRPDEHGITTAGQLIAPLEQGIATLEADPDRFKAMNPKNGWGSYDTLLAFLRNYLEACREYPDATVRVRR